MKINRREIRQTSGKKDERSVCGAIYLNITCLLYPVLDERAMTIIYLLMVKHKKTLYKATKDLIKGFTGLLLKPIDNYFLTAAVFALGIAILAVDRTITAWFERNFTFLIAI